MMTLSSLRTSSSISTIVLRRLGGVSRALRACFGAALGAMKRTLAQSKAFPPP